jgi:hypothetical protein
MAVTYINGIPCIDAGGGMRKLAALKPTEQDTAHFKLKQFSAGRTIDPSKWAECDLSSYKSPIRDQGHHGSCTGHAGVAALDIVRRQEGDDPVLLSCTFPYSLVNGNKDNGASVSSILKILEQYGTCTFAECGTDQIFQNQYSQSCFVTAKKYMAVEAFVCHSFEEVCEAVNMGFPTPFGIQVGQNFSRLNPDGVCPPPDTVVGGHALCGIGLKKSRTGTWLLKFQNSWTAQWGLGGYAYLSKGSFDNMVDAYAIMYAKNTDGPPPVVKEPKIILLPPIEPIAPEPEPVKPEEPVTIVPKEESLTAQLDRFTNEGGGSLVHVDPDAVMEPKKPHPREQGFRRRK